MKEKDDRRHWEIDLNKLIEVCPLFPIHEEVLKREGQKLESEIQRLLIDNIEKELD